MRGLVEAYRLEFRHIQENKVHLFLLFFLPALVIVAFAIASKETPFPGTNFSFYDFLAPQVFPTIIMFVTAQLTVLRIVAERAPHGTLDRDLLAISRSGMYFGKYIANAAIALLQCIAIYAVARLFFEVKILGSPLVVFFLMLLTSFFGLSLGLLISVFSSTKDQANQIVPFSVLILLVLSGILVPLDAMPAGMREGISYLPLTLSYKSLESVMLDKRSFEEIFSKVAILAIWTIGFLVAGVMRFSTERK